MTSRADDETKTNVENALGETQHAALIVSGPHGVTVHAIRRNATLTVGRSPECEIPIDHPSISRRHVRLHFGATWTAEDLGSTNKTTVAGKELHRGVRVPVAPGTTILVGGTVTIVIHGPSAADRTDRTSVASPLVHDRELRRVYDTLDEIAPTPLSVLVLGETGVGKEVFAEAVHARSQRASGPFVKLNCAALTESLLESELFGFEKGAFTGANAAKIGLFEAADGGTLFLDELGEMPLTTQAKLLRVLETGEVTRIGSVKPRTIDVRFVGATNRDLRRLVADGNFRADLYFRINGISVTLPPLRDRLDDIVPLARHFVQRVAQRLGRPSLEFTPSAVDALHRYSWPGNVRELRNVVERALILAKGPAIDAPDLAFQEHAVASPSSVAPVERPTLTEPNAGLSESELRDQMRAFERHRIEEALRKTHGNQTRAAQLLGVSRRTLINKLELHNFDRPRRR
jgi:transcriptional regulator with GAF, ATPase, and Fis domain